MPKDQWVIDECFERLDKLVYALGHLDIEAGSYMQAQYVHRIMDEYVRQFGKAALLEGLVELLYTHASGLETALPKEEDQALNDMLETLKPK